MREPIIDWIWPSPQSGRAGWRTKSPGCSRTFPGLVSGMRLNFELSYKDSPFMEHRMNPARIAIAAAVAGALASPVAVHAQGKVEKCYGVSKAGKNDCQTEASSCAGTSKKDNQPDAWIAVPKGTCEKIVGGMVKG
jgi:uncharacterized membrane protein